MRWALFVVYRLLFSLSLFAIEGGGDKPILGLKILMGVPIRVKDDDSVGGLEVQSEATGTGGEQEDKVLSRGVVPVFHGHPAVVGLGVTIKTEVSVLPPLAVILKDVHHFRHLEEHEDLVVGGLELREDALLSFVGESAGCQIGSLRSNKGGREFTSKSSNFPAARTRLKLTLSSLFI